MRPRAKFERDHGRTSLSIYINYHMSGTKIFAQKLKLEVSYSAKIKYTYSLLPENS